MLAMLRPGTASQAVGIGAVLTYLLFTLGSNIYAVIFYTVCWRLMANQAMKDQQPLSETFLSSVLPAIYQIAAGLIIAVPMVILGIICAMLMRISPALVALLMIGLFFSIAIRLCYSFIGIAIANKGPIEGLIHSWNMTSGKNYVDALFMCLFVIGSVFLMYLFFAAIGYGLFIMIPLHFANSFSLAHPSLIWILVALVLGILALFGYFVIMAFPVLVFINRNNVLFDARDLGKDTSFVPLPALELPDIHPNPEHMQEAQSTIHSPTLTEEDLPQMQEEQPVAPAPAPASVPQAASAPKPDSTPEKNPQAQPVALEGLEVSKSSINTSEKETDSLSEHLNKVYTPQKEDIIQYGEEDRMPTILFDDEMAKQLEENQAQYAPKSKEDNADKKDEGPGSIKMSKF